MPGIFEQAQKLHQAGKLAEAERLYQQILQGNGHDPEIWFLLGDALQGQGRPGPRSASLRQLTIVFSEGIVGSGRAFFEAVCREDLEGVVAKRLDGRYGPGRRAWIKIKPW